MSANIYWRPVNPTKGHELGQYAPSSFIASLNRAFGDLPLLFTEEIEAVKLEGMAAATEDARFRKGYQTLADAIRECGSIEVYAVY